MREYDPEMSLAMAVQAEGRARRRVYTLKKKASPVTSQGLDAALKEVDEIVDYLRRAKDNDLGQTWETLAAKAGRLERLFRAFHAEAQIVNARRDLGAKRSTLRARREEVMASR